MHTRRRYGWGGVVSAGAMAAAMSAAAVASECVEILVRDNEFAPAQVFARPGDSVVWVWQGGFHTAYSGASCKADEIYFQMELNPDNLTYEYVIPEDFAGTIPYYCQPHCTQGMKGLILVDPEYVAGDLDGDRLVSGSDLGLLLSNWGLCIGCGAQVCLADLDSNCWVDSGDLVLLGPGSRTRRPNPAGLRGTRMSLRSPHLPVKSAGPTRSYCPRS
jgi:plastocyanin